MKNRVAAITMAALLLLYLVLVMRYAFVLITTDVPAARAMGFALAVLPVVGFWALYAEIAFVLRGESMVRALAALGELPVDDLPRLPSGRIDPKEADKQFPAFQAEVEAAPADWKAWTRLGLAYDASGDRKRARWATRQAIRLRRGKPLSPRSA
ncbi:hypothetical protein B0I08_102382 [Glaciihabitans tibetensis]|uniref:Tetratricopeptide repeat protein n=1 Tax=Glaciihabitans tibetensis TaxID=1266600 RepID=A0A2T0VHQ4_9MICO|nr:hypothetical protein [Glaciihabitans tibetensis]PRY69705.1 hypothetical protein B0I08_102382 [Glaciihabitans tibetensis]